MDLISFSTLLRFSICMAGICLAKITLAQTDTSTGLLQEVVVTTQRSAKQALDIAASTQVIDKSYLNRFQPRTTPEALMGINGVFIQKTNHGGGSPFLRGLTGNQTLILVDGIRLNNSTFRYGPNQYLNTIDPFTIEKIEVAKGTGAVQYGSDAIGGTLQVFTAEPTFATGKAMWSGRATARYMTGDMEKTLRAQAIYSNQKVATTIGATYRNFGDLIGGDTTGRQHHSGYNEFAFDAKSNMQLSNTAVLTVAHQFVRQQHVPVYHKILLENFAVNEFHPQQRVLSYARLNLTNNNKLWRNVGMTASWQNTIEGRDTRKNNSIVLRRERDEVNTIGFSTNVSSQLTGVWTANSGIELYHDKVRSSRNDVNLQNAQPNNLRGLYPDGARYGNYSAYSLHRLDFKKWIADAGIRYNRFAISLTDATLGVVNIRPSAFVYNASLLYKITPRHQVYTSFNTGLRAPNVDDMGTLGVVDFRYELPAYGLSPERSANFELGYKVREQKWAATVSGYYMHLNNLITRVKSEGEVIGGYPVYRKVNVEKANIYGVETQFEYNVSSAWKVGANAAYARGESISRKEPLRRIPPLFGRVLSTYTKDKWYVSADIQYATSQNRLAQGDKDDNRIPAGGTPGWQTVNAYTGYSLSRLRLNAGIQNILNEDYRTHGSGINGVGRSIWISATVIL